MPAPSRTSIEEIVGQARRIIEEDGLDGLTMQKVAKAAGVRAPSLYKHVPSRGDLVRLVVEEVLADLRDVLDRSISGEDPGADLYALARAFRSFAHEHPESYRIAFGPMPEEWHPSPEMFVSASAAVLRTTAAICPERPLEAARLVTAWAHGFMTMELAGAFRMDGDLDEAFEFGVTRLGDALMA